MKSCNYLFHVLMTFFGKGGGNLLYLIEIDLTSRTQYFERKNLQTMYCDNLHTFRSVVNLFLPPPIPDEYRFATPIQKHTVIAASTAEPFRFKMSEPEK